MPSNQATSSVLNNQEIELLLQSLEHEKGGVQVYETALKCAVMPELAQEKNNLNPSPSLILGYRRRAVTRLRFVEAQ